MGVKSIKHAKWERDTEAIVSEYEREHVGNAEDDWEDDWSTGRLYPMEIQSPPISSIRH